MHDGFGAWSPSNRVAKANLLFETGEFPKKSEQMRFYGHGLHLFRFDQHASFASGFFDLRFTIYDLRAVHGTGNVTIPEAFRVARAGRKSYIVNRKSKNPQL